MHSFPDNPMLAKTVDEKERALEVHPG